MTKPKKKTGKEVIKASAAIQIEGKITGLQHRAWNVLLWKAYDELPHKERHSILMSDLIRTLEYDSGDQEYLKESLKALVHSSVEWNVLDKDGHTEWGVAALLAGARISRGVCVYEYGSILREKLYNPQMYARISLSMQNKFESKHSHALWEFCVDALGAKRDYGETSWIEIDKFRKMMGVADSDYYAAFFKKLKQQVITPALAEINKLSDFRVTVEYQRKGRKVTALKFKIQRVEILPELKEMQRDLFPDLKDMPVLVKELKDTGLSTQDALEVWQKGFKFVEEAVRPASSGEDEDAAFTRYVREKIHLLKRRQASGKVENSTGFLLEALKKNYANPEFVQESQRRALVTTQQTAQQRKREKQQLERQLEELKRACDESVSAICAEIATSFPDVLETATQSVVAANAILGLQALLAENVR